MSKHVRVVFDRRKRVEATGKGNVEIIIQLSRLAVKKIIVDSMTPEEWEVYKDAPYLKKEVANYEKIVNAMELLGEDMTVDNFNKHIGVDTPVRNTSKKKSKESVSETKDERINESFLDFMHDAIVKEKSAATTKRQKFVALDALRRWGGIVTFADISTKKLREYDAWLREDGTRSDVAVNNYHKRTKMYVRQAYEKGIIEKDYYSMVHFPRGKCKERNPLSEAELMKLRTVELPSREARVRDLFIFSAYTGLAFCDAQAFDFFTMAEQRGDMFYIDGSRLKTGTKFYTPILPPAMEVLKRYNFQLPKISNQKGNEYLRVVKSIAGIRKPLTFHIARHSFATLSLSHDVPIEKVARMLGHTDIKTTQIYAKILKSTIETYATELSKAII
ncbi:MAG: tyrosine-type recombinase/integrase [Bacteroidaceae bacterium]|nr:tyrosine-type recombinase/integrase [Bacteroidaceae bacterium]